VALHTGACIQCVADELITKYSKTQDTWCTANALTQSCESTLVLLLAVCLSLGPPTSNGASTDPTLDVDSRRQRPCASGIPCRWQTALPAEADPAAVSEHTTEMRILLMAAN
jgi:hypothetical protein